MIFHIKLTLPMVGIVLPAAFVDKFIALQHSLAVSSSLLKVSYVLGSVFVEHRTFVMSLVLFESALVLDWVVWVFSLEPPLFTVAVSHVVLPVPLILVVFTLM